MKLFELTNQGLTVIGVLVCVLWGVLLFEHSLNQRTQEEYNNLLRDWPMTPALNVNPPAAQATGHLSSVG
jgi:hypothetical protein